MRKEGHQGPLGWQRLIPLITTTAADSLPPHTPHTHQMKAVEGLTPEPKGGRPDPLQFTLLERSEGGQSDLPVGLVAVVLPREDLREVL